MTPSRYMLINTILSRCQIISLLNKKEENNIVSYVLKLSNPNLESDEEKYSYAMDKIDTVLSFVEQYEKHKKDTLLFTKDLIFKKISLREELLCFFEIMKVFYYDVLTNKVKNNIVYFNDFYNIINQITEKNDIRVIAKKLKVIESSIEKIKLNCNLNLIVDKFIVESEGV